MVKKLLFLLCLVVAASPINIGRFQDLNVGRWQGSNTSCTPPTISYTQNPVCTAYVLFSQNATLVGGTCDSVTTDGLPEGLSLNATTGAVTGTPLSDSVKTAYRVIAWGCDNDTTYDTLTVVYGPVTIDSVAPDTIVSDDSATIYGRHFGIYPDSLSGTMGGEAIDFVSCSNDTIRIVTPTGLDTGYYDLILGDGITDDTLADAFYVTTIAMCSLTVATTTGGTVDPSGLVIDTCGDETTITMTASESPGGYSEGYWVPGAGVTLADSTDASTTATGSGTVTAHFYCQPADIAYAPDTIQCTVGVEYGPLVPDAVEPADSITISPALPTGGTIVDGTISLTAVSTIALTRYIITAHNCNSGHDTLYIAVIDTACSAPPTSTGIAFSCTVGVALPTPVAHDITNPRDSTALLSGAVPGLEWLGISAEWVGTPTTRGNYLPVWRLYGCDDTDYTDTVTVIDTSSALTNYRSINNSINTGINLSIP